MSNIIDSIKLSGVTYTIQGSGGGGNPTVEVTQAEYDAMVTAGTVQADTYYIITDAQAGDLTQYWTSAQTQSAITQAVSGKQDTLVSGTNIKTINNTSILGSGNIDIQGGGGGKAIEAGRGISITTGETADTISCTIPAYRSGSSNGISLNYDSNTASGSRSLAGGSNCKATSENAVALGYNSKAKNDNAFAMGQYAIASGFCSAAICREAQAKNMAEFACGQHNVSNKANDTFGNSGNTLFSVGNGTADNARHNAFEIRQNGDIYITSGGTDILLQDHLGGGGGGGSSYTAGRGIDITNDTISFSLPISAGTGSNSIVEGNTNNRANGEAAHAEGSNTAAVGDYSFAGGRNSSANTTYSFAHGRYINANNESEHSIGKFNVSNTGSTDALKTLFSVGNGSSVNARHNAFEIRQNGDIYITSGGTDIKLQDNLGGGGGGSSYTAGDGIDITNDVISVNSGVVTTNTEQTISGKKIFKNSDKPIEFKQKANNSKVGFSIKNTASTNNELATFELRPNTFTIDNVQHPLLYFGHYRNTQTANAGVPQTVIGFRQYDQKNAAAYHYLLPLPEKAKTPFSLTTSFKDYYAPMGFKNGSTMITADNTGVVDLSSEFSGKVDTSAITTAITSSSTDAQVPSAKAIYDIIGDIETLLSQI